MPGGRNKSIGPVQVRPRLHRRRTFTGPDPVPALGWVLSSPRAGFEVSWARTLQQEVNRQRRSVGLAPVRSVHLHGDQRSTALVSQEPRRCCLLFLNTLKSPPRGEGKGRPPRGVRGCDLWQGQVKGKVPVQFQPLPGTTGAETLLFCPVKS